MTPIGIGTDIESVDRFVQLDRSSHRAFLERIFTQDELNYCFSKKFPAPHLAARFCGKEAVIKALSEVGIKELIPHHAIEIVREESGVPRIKVDKDLSLTIHVSLSHSKDRAIAFAIAYGDNRKKS